MRCRDGTMVPSFWARARDDRVHFVVGDWGRAEERLRPAACGFDGPRALVNPPYRPMPRPDNRGFYGPSYHPTPVAQLCPTCQMSYEDATGFLLAEVER